MPSLVPPVIHPLLVHGPIILLPLAALLATLAVQGRYAWARPATLFVLVLGVLAAGAAVGSGLYEWLPIEDEHEGTALGDAAEDHERLGLVTLATSLGLAIFAWWRRATLFDGRSRWAFVAALWLVVVLVVLTGWYGGSLVYEYGLNTPTPPP